MNRDVFNLCLDADLPQFTAASAPPPLLPALPTPATETLQHISEGAYGLVYRSGDTAYKQFCGLDCGRVFPRAVREVSALYALSNTQNCALDPQLNISRQKLLAELTRASNPSEVPAETPAGSEGEAEGAAEDGGRSVAAGRPYDLGVRLIEKYTTVHSLIRVLSLSTTAAEALGVVSAVALGLLHALQETHSRGIIHRDVKPANILLSLDGVVTLCDWGMCRSTYGTEACPPPPPRDKAGAADRCFSGPLTLGMRICTPRYRAPELGGADAGGRPMTWQDTAADVWSAGCIICEMLCGSNPFVSSVATVSWPDISRAWKQGEAGEGYNGVAKVIKEAFNSNIITGNGRHSVSAALRRLYPTSALTHLDTSCTEVLRALLALSATLMAEPTMRPSAGAALAVFSSILEQPLDGLTPTQHLASLCARAPAPANLIKQ